MASIILDNASVLVGDELRDDEQLVIVDGMIAERSSGDRADRIDCDGLTVVPGFIDVHIHGAMGIDVNAADVGGLLEVARFLARNGVTAWVPTLVPDSDENYARVVSEIDKLMEVQSGELVARAVGVHYEGVFANEKMCGALRPDYFKTFTGTELEGLPKLRQGVHVTTFAPEVAGGVELAGELSRNGWIASIGHTRADLETLDRAYEAGARHVTHFFNAMTGIHHRDVGVAGWTLAKAGVTFDIIADGIHVHPTMLEFACRAKSTEKVSLISDSVAPTGLGDGEFEIWGEKITVADGRTQNERGSIAGSVISMQDAVIRMLSQGFSVTEVSKMASTNPSRLLGMDSSRGKIANGMRADLVGLDAEGNVKLTVIGGEVAFDAR